MERQWIGRFEVRHELGRGSMGIVHHAYDPIMGRDVAIKTVLLPQGLGEEKKHEFRTRFLREARAAGRLSHPGIVTIYDFNDDGSAAAAPFIAMEYVDGRTLHELIVARGRLDPSWSLDAGETLADALDQAHKAGVVHRDLKPANILVRAADGVAKISDFGVARVNHSDLTGAGVTYGSPAYMAPERLSGAPADGRSDLFALAVILYEALCGQRPFGGDDFASTCAAILHEPPRSICEREPRLAPAFDGFFARALAKDPTQRFRSGADFRNALRALRHEQDCFETGQATRRVAVSPARRRRGPMAAATALALVTVAAGVWSWRLAESPARHEAVGVAQPAAATLPAEAHLEVRVLSRVKDGALTLFVDGKQVYSKRLATEETHLFREREEISARIEVPAGRHTLVAELLPADADRKFEQRLSFEIAPGAVRTLTISAGKKMTGPRLTVTLD